MASARAGTASAAAGAVVAQGVTAAGSLALQVVAARALGAAGYGTFTVVLAGLLVVTALHGGCVGDSRTVLDRTSPAVRGTLFALSAAFVVGGAALAFGGAVLLGLLDVGEAAVFGVLTAVWVVEDGGRRLFMARLEFWSLVLNDVTYVGVALVAVGAVQATTGAVTLTGLLAAMAAGAAAAVVLSVLQLPRHELAPGPVTGQALRQVFGFGGWRAAHAGLRPVSTLLLRAFVRGVASAAALGRLESARLLLAPVLLLANGVGSFLLPWAVRHRRADPVAAPALLGPSLLLGGVTLAYAAAVTAAAPAAARLLTSGEVPVDRMAVAGWGLFAVAFVLGLPAGSAVLAGGRAGEVLRVRAVDSAIGLVLAVVLALASVRLAPFGLAAGAGVGAVLLWVRARTAVVGPPTAPSALAT